MGGEGEGGGVKSDESCCQVQSLLLYQCVLLLFDDLALVAFAYVVALSYVLAPWGGCVVFCCVGLLLCFLVELLRGFAEIHEKGITLET